MPDLDHDTPPRSPITLTSLPDELLIQIALLLDKTSSLSFALVARGLSTAADSRIWRDIDLHLDEHYGELVLEYPFTEGTEEFREWEMEEQLREGRLHRATLQQMVARLLAQGNERRWTLVRKITVAFRRGAGEDLALLFQQDLTNLRELVISRPAHRQLIYKRDRGSQSLGRLLFGSGFHFPSLKTIRLHPSTDGLPTGGNLESIFDMAPRLTSLDFHVHAFASHRSLDATPPVPSDTSLRTLRITFIAYAMRKDSAEPTAPNVLQLLKHCPRIRQLSILAENRNIRRNDLFAPVTSIIRKYAEMTDLYWEVLPNYIGRETPRPKSSGQLGATEGFPLLRRMMIKDVNWMGTFNNLHTLPSIELLYIDPTHTLLVNEDDQYDPDHFVKTTRRNLEREIIRDAPDGGLSADFAAQLRRSPKLRTIEQVEGLAAGGAELWEQLNDIETEGGVTGHVWSLRHAGSELLHVHILPSDLTPVDSILHHPPYDRLQWHETAEREWVDYTDFDGLPVPLQTITQMREVEGLGVGEGYRRGVEVGEDAWQVLLDWKEGILAGEAESPA